jgi:hypothetical protein
MRLKLFFVILIFTTTVFSQNPEHPEIYVGPNFGVTGSMVMFKPAVNQSYLLGYNGGAVFRFISDKNVGFQAELNFSQRGWKESGNVYTRQLNYIEMPFMTHIYVGKKSRFFFNIGPKISYLISENVLVNNTVNSTLTEQITNVQNPLDYGLCTGFGFLFKTGKLVYQLDTRANYSLSDIFSNDKRDYFDTSNNLNLSVNFALLFQLK